MNWIKESETLIILPGRRYQKWTEWKDSRTLIISPGSRYQKWTEWKEFKTLISPGSRYQIWTEWKESGTLIIHLNNHKSYQLNTKYINMDSIRILADYKKVFYSISPTPDF